MRNKSETSFFQGKISFEVRPSVWRRTTFHGQILSAHMKQKQEKTVLIPGSPPSARSLTGKDGTEQRKDSGIVKITESAENAPASAGKSIREFGSKNPEKNSFFLSFPS